MKKGPNWINKTYTFMGSFNDFYLFRARKHLNSCCAEMILNIFLMNYIFYYYSSHIVFDPTKLFYHVWQWYISVIYIDLLHTSSIYRWIGFLRNIIAQRIFNVFCADIHGGHIGFEWSIILNTLANAYNDYKIIQEVCYRFHLRFYGWYNSSWIMLEKTHLGGRGNLHQLSID